MGFWKQLFGIEELPTYRGHVPPKDIPKSFDSICDKIHKEHDLTQFVKHTKDISEPVLSIIKTLKDGEWSFRGDTNYGSVHLVFTHEWFGNFIGVFRSTNYLSKEDKPYCTAEWMTQVEKEAVGSICWQIHQGRVKWEKEQSLAKQRESFMVLVKSD